MNRPSLRHKEPATLYDKEILGPLLSWTEQREQDEEL